MGHERQRREIQHQQHGPDAFSQFLREILALSIRNHCSLPNLYVMSDFGPANEWAAPHCVASRGDQASCRLTCFHLRLASESVPRMRVDNVLKTRLRRPGLAWGGRSCLVATSSGFAGVGGSVVCGSGAASSASYAAPAVALPSRGAAVALPRHPGSHLQGAVPARGAGVPSRRHSALRSHSPRREAASRPYLVQPPPSSSAPRKFAI